MNRSEGDPRLVREADFPATASATAQNRFLLNYAVLAPSGHNTQPWLFQVEGERIHVFADRRRALPVVDPLDRELTISCGAATGTIEVAARFFGMDSRVQWLPHPHDPDLLATVHCTPGTPPSVQEQDNFRAIGHRRTNRKSYRQEQIPGTLLERCAELAAARGASFHAMDDPALRLAVASLVAEGDRLQFADKRFRRELAAWVHSARLGSRDGMSGQGFGMPDLLSSVGGLVIRTFDIGDGIAAADRDKIMFGSPALGLFASGGDDTQCWLDTGRALAHVLLELTAQGHASSYLNQPIEVDSLRERVAAAFDIDCMPQLLIRIGRGTDAPSSARRPLSEVLIG